MLVNVQSLIIDCSAIDVPWTPQYDWEEQLNLLMLRTSTIYEKIKKWLTIEAEPLILPKSSQQSIHEQIDYPDIICGTIDSVANTTLLKLNTIFYSICRTKCDISIAEEKGPRQRVESPYLLQNEAEMGYRLWRATTAFNFVQGQSMLGTKTLEFGLAQIRVGMSSCSVDEVKL